MGNQNQKQNQNQNQNQNQSARTMAIGIRARPRTRIVNGLQRKQESDARATLQLSVERLATLAVAGFARERQFLSEEKALMCNVYYINTSEKLAVLHYGCYALHNSQLLFQNGLSIFYWLIHFLLPLRRNVRNRTFWTRPSDRRRSVNFPYTM